MQCLTKINEHLSEIEIINKQTIQEIRNFISVQYKTASPEQRAKQLAKEIHKAIDRQLPNFSLDLKKNVRMKLVSKIVSSKSLTINANDVIEASVEHATDKELKENLPLWMQNVIKLDSHVVDHVVNHLIHDQKSQKETALTAEMIGIDKPIEKTKLLHKKIQLIGTMAVIMLASAIFFIANAAFTKESTIVEELETMDQIERMPNELPSYLQYETINEEALRAFLVGRNSLLADEPYFSTIINVAEEFNIHPLLLFAITGQEQAFVPKDHKDADKIANNPFNVYHSWQEFNTNILESTQIAARTIVNLSEGRPQDADPIQWINRKYAEDENWWVGVSAIFQELQDVQK